ncbi:MAG: NUDIX domain-containing protein, partial [Dehalococcoidia bacterium]|nr:NUDIX domain-containing protein [Dehalococcoidia bacterium]
ILLIQRGYGKDKGKWSLPGGMRDKGESYKQTAVRETREETGIKMSADVLYHRGSRGNYEIWKGKRIGGRLKFQRRECLDAKWFGKDMLPHDDNLAFGPDKIAIGKWAKEDPTSRRVHYPHRVKLGKVGFGLVVNRKKEILLIRQGGGRRKDKWSLPGGRPRRNEGRQDAAVREIRNATGIKFSADRLYYENRHRAKVWIGKHKTGWLPNLSINLKANASWFPIDKLPDDDSLAFAVDVRTVQKWASENPRSRRVSY